MQCIFCKKDSASSKSVEHIIPESLWNTKHILPAGVVCDKCNNYFSRKVERPFISSPNMEALRFHQAIPSKKGKIPPIKGAIYGSFSSVKVRRVLEKDDVFMFVEINEEQLKIIESGISSQLFLPTGFDGPAVKETSRFIAKVALEAIAQRLVSTDGGIDYIVSETQFDPIRNHARYGQPKEWPYFSRRIYDASEDVEIHGPEGQVMHEYDFLYTDEGEMYFVLALYGIEMTINIGWPDIEGYIGWLKKNNNVSPLYWGKNAS
ncbi:HNH endonuclease [Pantoea cypripedii]|uniref:HNH endonuclease n=1 Tax=Pantoea cypripedii TaxID=55209 RepID=UPI002FC8994B